MNKDQKIAIFWALSGVGLALIIALIQSYYKFFK